MENNQKGFAQVILVIGILVALGVIGFVLYKQNSEKLSFQKDTYVPAAYQSQYDESANSIPSVESSEDLSKVDTTVEATDTTQLDTDLNSLETDLATF